LDLVAKLMADCNRKGRFGEAAMPCDRTSGFIKEETLNLHRLKMTEFARSFSTICWKPNKMTPFWNSPAVSQMAAFAR
jgi:hypothetical protein